MSTMVFAFFIQTLTPKGCDVLYYRYYTCYENVCVAPKEQLFPDSVSKSDIESDAGSCTSFSRAFKLYETSIEKKELLHYLAKKIHMHYFMKRSHSLQPSQFDKTDHFVNGLFIERKWKEETGATFELPVVWAGVSGLGFALVCKNSDNYVQAQNVLDIIIAQLEKHLHFLSNPAMPLTLIETVALIVDQFLPAGQLLFMNSKVLQTLEKQLEVDLFAK